MADTLDEAARSQRMSLIRGRDTKPEILVRRLLHRKGYRFRLHATDIPGRPDIVFRGRRRAVFVHGCFWHRHPDPGCPLTRMPKSRLGFWDAKFSQNVERDKRKQSELEALGWRYLVVWECELRHMEQLENKLIGFLEDRT